MSLQNHEKQLDGNKRPRCLKDPVKCLSNGFRSSVYAFPVKTGREHFSWKRKTVHFKCGHLINANFVRFRQTGSSIAS